LPFQFRALSEEVNAMFQQILLPLDLTDRHARALTIAAELSSQSKGAVTLLHVIETIAGLSLDEERDFYDRLEDTAKAQMNQLGNQLAKHGVSWKSEIAYGQRVAECLRHATEIGADLIILTAPKIDPAHPAAGWGSPLASS
jgi:nucleotide-binding universal stress UspA family protein